MLKVLFVIASSTMRCLLHLEQSTNQTSTAAATGNATGGIRLFAAV